MLENMDTESSIGQMENNIKEAGKTESSMDKALIEELI
jgi:hypothetical protein